MAEDNKLTAFLELVTKFTVETAKKIPGKTEHESVVYGNALTLATQSSIIANVNIRKARRILSQARRLANFKDEGHGQKRE